MGLLLREQRTGQLYLLESTANLGNIRDASGRPQKHCVMIVPVENRLFEKRGGGRYWSAAAVRKLREYAFTPATESRFQMMLERVVGPSD